MKWLKVQKRDLTEATTLGYRAWIVISVLCALSVALPTVVLGDSSAIPTAVHECEGANLENCADLTLTGKTYTGTWTSGNTSSIVIEHWGKDGVLLTREDTSGIFSGVKVRYVGTIQADGSVTGTGTVEWPGHFEGTIDGPWMASPIVEPAKNAVGSRKAPAAHVSAASDAKIATKGSNPPSQIIECEYAGDLINCAGLTRNGNVYSGSWRMGQVAQLEIVQWDMSGITLARHDTAGSMEGLVGTYNGKFHSDGSISGSVTWQWPGHFASVPGKWSAEAVPGSADGARGVTIHLTTWGTDYGTVSGTAQLSQMGGLATVSLDVTTIGEAASLGNIPQGVGLFKAQTCKQLLASVHGSFDGRILEDSLQYTAEVQDTKGTPTTFNYASCISIREHMDGEENRPCFPPTLRDLQTGEFVMVVFGKINFEAVACGEIPRIVSARSKN